MPEMTYAESTLLQAQNKRIEELQAECEEQARLLGMSSEREAKLLAEIDTLHEIARKRVAEIERLEQENECVANNAIACTETLRRERKEFRAEIKRLNDEIEQLRRDAATRQENPYKGKANF